MNEATLELKFKIVNLKKNYLTWALILNVYYIFFSAEKPLSGKGWWSDFRFSFTKSQELFAQI